MRLRKHKYRAKPQRTSDGYFASKRELSRWNQLKLRQADGQISELQKQVPFVLHGANGDKICKYILDYVYRENGSKIAEDCKGFKTEAYKLKRKLFIAEYGNEYEHRES